MTTIDTEYEGAPLDDDSEDLDDVLPVRRRRLPLLTRLLLVGLVAAAAFVGGVEIQKHYGSSSTSSPTGGSTGAASSLAARRATFGGGGRAGRGAGFFGGGAAGSAGGATVGLITLIRGSTLYVTDFSGNTVKVSAGGVKVSKTVSAPLKTLRPGDSVVVRGTKQKNGTTKASSITIGTGGNG